MHTFAALSLAWADFIPSIIFATGAYFLVKLMLRECGRPCAALTLVGSSLVFLAGFFKAMWKWLYLAHGADLQALSVIQFPLLAPGFLLMFIGALGFSRRSGQTASSPVLAIATWKIPFLVVMVLSSLGVQGMLAFVALRRRLKLAALGFMLAFIVILAMGRLAGVEQTVNIQWIEEGINTMGQMGFSAGCYLLHRQTARTDPRSS